jgi:hypothetical protein
VRKEILVHSEQPSFQIIHHFRWPSCPNGSLRLGHITINPKLFDQNNLFYCTHNGGDFTEKFLLKDESINHLAPVSSLVTANSGLGVTEGLIELGDHRRLVRIQVDKSTAALTGHIVYAPVDEKYFFRVAFSAMEMDDTSCAVAQRSVFSDLQVKFRLSSENT